MNFTQDDIVAIIGSLYLENLSLRRQLAQEQNAKQAAPKPVEPPKSE